LNAISDDRIKSFGLDIHNAADQAVLRARLDSAAAAARGFNKLPYATYSAANTVAQSLRPFPQFGTQTNFGVPLGLSWYDALQVKATKRYSHGLNLTYTFTWQKEDNISAARTTTCSPRRKPREPSPPTRNHWCPSSRSTTSCPAQVRASGRKRSRSGWTVGGIMRWASGQPIPVPASQNQLSALTFQTTRMNRVAGVPLYLKDINGSIDPSKDFVLNPAAWADPPAGQYGTSPTFYDDFRYQRRPDEQFSFGREFPLSAGGRTFSVRAEFFNAFNRTSMNNPNATNPLQTQLRNARACRFRASAASTRARRSGLRAAGRLSPE